MEQLYSNSSAILDGEVTSWIVPFKMYLQYIKDFFNDPVVLDEGNNHPLNVMHQGIIEKLK